VHSMCLRGFFYIFLNTCCSLGRIRAGFTRVLSLRTLWTANSSKHASLVILWKLTIGTLLIKFHSLKK